MAGTPREAGRTTASRVLAILEVFGEDPGPHALSTIAAATSMPLTTVHRLVGELEQWGALLRGPDGRYQIGIRLWEIGQNAGLRLRDIVHPPLQDLFDLTHETVHFVVRRGTEVIYVDRIYGSRRVPRLARVGSRLPLHPTAVGKVLLAYQDPWFRETYLAHTLERRSRFTITEPARLARELDTIREQGYARTQEEMALGSCSVAIPVRAPNDEVVAAIGIVLPSSRSADIARFLPPLRGTGARLEKVFKALPQPVEQAIRTFWLG
ncbi:IclR family transcriptional regulator [Rhodococcus sp. AG1013]|nr:IclR family transcriptional regulator [Rhodococcus sp. W8901]RDI34043.1 IclR family transcriptional regulator [Rhodococcus sp. AG1013]